MTVDSTPTATFHDWLVDNAIGQTVSIITGSAASLTGFITQVAPDWINIDVRSSSTIPIGKQRLRIAAIEFLSVQ